MNARKTLSTLISVFAFTLTSPAKTDQIILNNGDILQGTLASQTDIYVVWGSDSFGILQIPINQISSINKASADLATEKPEQKPLFKANIGLSGAYLDGNEQRDDLEFDAGFSIENENTTHYAVVNYETLGSDNNSTINDYGIKYVIDWSISDSWYWGNSFFYGADDKRQIDQSISIGTNMGYQLWKTHNSNLSTEIGLAWIDDKLFSSINDERIALVWSGNYQKQLNKKVSLTYSHQLNVSIKDSDNAQLSADIGFIIPVSDRLDTKISWDWTMDNQPEQGNEKIDRKLKFGADYSF